MSAIQFVPVIDVAQTNLVFSLGDQRIENVFHNYNAAGWDVSSMTTLASGYKEWFRDVLAPNVTYLMNLNLIRVVDMTTQNAPGIDYVDGLPLGGEALTVDALPSTVAAVVKWVTLYRGRSYRGRTYHTGIPENVTVINTLNTTFRDTLQAAYDELRQFFATTTPLVVVSRFQNGAYLTTGIHTTITGVYVSGVLGNQRRRRPGRGV